MEEEILQATHQGELKVGDIVIPCAVLNDEKRTRVLTLRGFTKALGRVQRRKGIALQSGAIPPPFLAANNLKGFIPVDLLGDTIPILFKMGGAKAYGYKAALLPAVCDVFLKAKDAGVLLPRQEHIAKQCEILVRGLATVGVIALVDEATHYQEDRARDALEEILRNFISAELLKWVKTFPDDFYRQMFRLRNWQYSQFSVKRPSVAGRITNDIIYERLAPGVLDQLKRITPRDIKGRTKHRYHQRLTSDIGHPALREHIASVITLMKVSTSWRRFYAMLNRALPRWGSTLPMALDFKEEDEVS
ncbi:IS1595 family transposase ISRhba1 [subsurface metagenome]